MIGPESDKDEMHLIRTRHAKCSVDILSWELSPSGFNIALSHVLLHVVVVTSVILAVLLDVVPSIIAVVSLPLVVVEAAHFVLPKVLGLDVGRRLVGPLALLRDYSFFFPSSRLQVGC